MKTTMMAVLAAGAVAIGGCGVQVFQPVPSALAQAGAAGATTCGQSDSAQLGDGTVIVTSESTTSEVAIGLPVARFGYTQDCVSLVVVVAEFANATAGAIIIDPATGEKVVETFTLTEPDRVWVDPERHTAVLEVDEPNAQVAIESLVFDCRIVIEAKARVADVEVYDQPGGIGALIEWEDGDDTKIEVDGTPVVCFDPLEEPET